MLLILIFLGYLIFTNIRLAKKKGQKPILWAVITFFAFFLSYMIVGSIYITMIYKGPITREALEAYLMREPMVMAMLLAIGVGGVLIVRFILEKKKDATEKPPQA